MAVAWQRPRRRSSPARLGRIRRERHVRCRRRGRQRPRRRAAPAKPATKTAWATAPRHLRASVAARRPRTAPKTKARCRRSSTPDRPTTPLTGTSRGSPSRARPRMSPPRGLRRNAGLPPARRSASSLPGAIWRSRHADRQRTFRLRNPAPSRLREHRQRLRRIAVRPAIKTGDTLIVLAEQVVAIAMTWPFAVTATSGALHALSAPRPGEDLAALARSLHVRADDFQHAADLARRLGFPLDPPAGPAAGYACRVTQACWPQSGSDVCAWASR